MQSLLQLLLGDFLDEGGGPGEEVLIVLFCLEAVDVEELVYLFELIPGFPVKEVETEGGELDLVVVLEEVDEFLEELDLEVLDGAEFQVDLLDVALTDEVDEPGVDLLLVLRRADLQQLVVEVQLVLEEVLAVDP